MKETICYPWYLWDYWESIEVVLQGINFIIKHVFRERNQATDFLVWEGKRGKATCYLDSNINLTVARFHQNGQVWFSQ